MKYYKLNNEVYAYSDEQVAKGLAEGKAEMTAEEVEVHINPHKTTQQLKDEYSQILVTHLNTKAQERGYDSIHTASLRAALVNSPFHDEGVAYGTWMDLCNAKGYEILASVQAGTIALPTEDEFIAMLPVLVLP